MKTPSSSYRQKLFSQLLALIAGALLAASPLTVRGANVLITVGNAVKVFSAGWAEVTTAAFGPGEHPSCPNGRLFFGASSSIAATDLAGNVLTQWTAQLNETYPPHIIYDNHLVKTKTGALVYTFEGVTWNDNVSPHPWWWNNTVTYPLKGQSRPGGRGNIYVFRSTDCGTTWNHISDIDAAKLTVAGRLGVCSSPRLINDSQGKRSEAGGWDGHFLYADPYAGGRAEYLFVSTTCDYGSAQENEAFQRALLIASYDGGYTWSVIGDKRDQWIWRAPISSINSGKVGFAFWGGTELKFSVFDATANTVDLSQAATIATFTPAGPGEPPPTLKTDNTFMWGFPSLAGNNLNPPRFYAAMFNWSGGELTFNLYNATATTATPLGNPVKPQTAGGATIHASFIESLPNSTIAVYYWTDINPSQPNTYSVRFQVLEDGDPLLAVPGQLTLQNNQPYTWPYNGQFIGDYHTGAVYQDGDAIKFVAPWSENGSLHFNTITVAPTPPAATLPVPISPNYYACVPAPGMTLVSATPATAQLLAVTYPTPSDVRVILETAAFAGAVDVIVAATLPDGRVYERGPSGWFPYPPATVLRAASGAALTMTSATDNLYAGPVSSLAPGGYIGEVWVMPSGTDLTTFNIFTSPYYRWCYTKTF